jgi:hypothetical protein
VPAGGLPRRPGRRTELVHRLYERLPSIDFSRAVLQSAGEELRVIAVPPCGWNDVGTPETLAICAARATERRGGGRSDGGGYPEPPLDLFARAAGHGHDRQG